MLQMLDILSDALEETPSPCFALEEALTFFLVLVAIFTRRAAILTAISFIAPRLISSSFIGPSPVAALIPGQLKPVHSRAAFRVLDRDNRWTSAAWRGHKFLPPASFYRSKLELASIRRYGAAALELAELRRSTG
jgi:hypothetical protein